MASSNYEYIKKLTEGSAYHHEFLNLIKGIEDLAKERDEALAKAENYKEEFKTFYRACEERDLEIRELRRERDDARAALKEEGITLSLYNNYQCLNDLGRTWDVYIVKKLDPIIEEAARNNINLRDLESILHDMVSVVISDHCLKYGLDKKRQEREQCG